MRPLKQGIRSFVERRPALKRLAVRLLRALEPLRGRAEQKQRRRLQWARSCRDTQDIPKVADAGEIQEHDGRRVQVMHNGLRVLAGTYQSEWMSEIITALRGHHEPQEERVFHEVLKHVRDDACMIELGAWWAYYSMWFLHGHPQRRAFLIEPIEERIETGRENFRINGLAADFTVGFLGEAHAGPGGRFTDWDGTLHDVPQVDLNSFTDDKKIDFIDILHSDIQGGEQDMLASIRPMLEQQRVGYLFVSTHLDCHEPCRELLRAVGYREIAEHSIEESFSADGLIVAQCSRVPQVPEVAISRR
ncbi:MAG: hypothetical protein HKN58_00800 [Xanthomonadales bacterium]|nr:hypothetical protein [Xanthomonadales bacterium]